MSKRAIITGITGQDGSYLAELLLEKGYEVVGVARRLSAPNTERIEHLLGRIELRPADLLDSHEPERAGLLRGADHGDGFGVEQGGEAVRSHGATKLEGSNV